MKARALLLPGVAFCLVSLLLVWYFALGPAGIHAAARRGDADAVKRRLALGISPDSRHLLTAETPLIEACRNGCLDAVKVLIKAGANVNLQGEAFYGPLHCAAYGGHVDTLKYLLEHGARVDLFDGHDRPMNSAAKGGHIEIAKVLLEHGADVNAHGIDDATPLENAVSHGHAEMVRFLLNNGAEINARGLYGRTALHVAADLDYVEIGRLLLDHGADPGLNCNGRPVEGRSPQFRELLGRNR